MRALSHACCLSPTNPNLLQARPTLVCSWCVCSWPTPAAAPARAGPRSSAAASPHPCGQRLGPSWCCATPTMPSMLSYFTWWSAGFTRASYVSAAGAFSYVRKCSGGLAYMSLMRAATWQEAITMLHISQGPCYIADSVVGELSPQG